MPSRVKRFIASVTLLAAALALAACGGGSASLYVPDLISKASEYNGKEVTVSGAYLDRGGAKVLALGVSTLDNGLDAQALGEQIWLEGFPEEVTAELHRPGDAVYGFVRVSGRFESGGSYGTDGAFKHRITVSAAEPIERVRRTEQRISNQPLGEGKVSLFELAQNPAQYNGQTVTTQGYYFWNGVIYVLAEGVSVEEDGGSPQPVGQAIWMEGFPPPVSGQLNVGPNNSYVWGLVEVTGQFSSGGGFGRDGAYAAQLVLDPNDPASARPLTPQQ
ncbi:MAG: hypothetical protein DIU80_003630 [Chloroflexota bacterium]|nr:MAG: hypothetical protein DIU80_00195 [Chloroflexota bacterium]